jgi:hypothetical protein
LSIVYVIELIVMALLIPERKGALLE